MLSAMKLLVVLLSSVWVVNCRSIDGQSKPCGFGDGMVADGEVAMSIASKCMALVCHDGKIMQHMVGAHGDTGCCIAFDTMYPALYKTAHCLPVACRNGTWVPVNFMDPCCGLCNLYTYSHFNTFDSHHYDWHGYCNYTLFAHSHPSGEITTAVFTEMNRVGPCATVFGHTTFRNDPHTIINITKTLDLRVNEEVEVNNNIVAIPHDGITFIKSSDGTNTVLSFWNNTCLIFLGSSNITVRYCPFHLDIWTRPVASASSLGLCGIFNYNPMDDFTTPMADMLPLQSYPINFPDKYWRAPEQTAPACKDPNTSTSVCNGTTGNKCRLQEDSLNHYQQMCESFLTGLHPHHPTLVKFYVPACVADICLASQGDLTYTSGFHDFVTDILGNYSEVTHSHLHDISLQPSMEDRSMCLTMATTIPVLHDDVTAAHTTPLASHYSVHVQPPRYSLPVETPPPQHLHHTVL